MFGPCKVCSEKDKRIEDIKALLALHIELLKKATIKEDPFKAQAISSDMNRAFDGGGSQVELSSIEREQFNAVEKQAKDMLYGSY